MIVARDHGHQVDLVHPELPQGVVERVVREDHDQAMGRDARDRVIEQTLSLRTAQVLARDDPVQRPRLVNQRIAAVLILRGARASAGASGGMVASWSSFPHFSSFGNATSAQFR